jgi:hypothetical protein
MSIRLISPLFLPRHPSNFRPVILVVLTRIEQDSINISSESTKTFVDLKM